MLKKIIKKIIILVIIMIILWAIILVINVVRCLNYKQPLTFLAIGGLNDETGGEFIYPGYSFEVHTYYMGKVFKTKMKFLNMTVFETPSLYKPAKISRSPENVKIEIKKNSISKNGVQITITDNNETPYMWNNYYTIEKKIDNDWKKIKPQKNIVNETDYNIDENSQIIIEIDWSQNYGQLSNGTYRIVKTIYDNVDIYSNEFEIDE